VSVISQHLLPFFSSWVNKCPILSLWCTGLNFIKKEKLGGMILGLADKAVTKKRGNKEMEL
jgi:hypothetical protein